MNQSRILSKHEQDKQHVVQIDQGKQEQYQMLKILASNANKSFVGKRSKQKPEQINVQDVKPIEKSRIFQSKSNQHFPDLRVSKLPNYNKLMIQNIQQNQNQNCWCSIVSNSQQVDAIIQQSCGLILYKKLTSKVLYCINFDTIQVQLHQQFNKNPNQFLLIADKLKLKIMHKNSTILKEWHQKLQLIISQSYGKQFHIKNITEKSPQIFYSRLFCTQDQFTKNCQTGDILLFQDQHFFAKAQRFILNADYDHVAMIIRDKKYGILMFQANSFKGVSLTPWNCMVKFGWYKYIQRIVWRKLQNVQRTQFFQKVIHQFVKQNLKQKYYISFQKLLSNKSYIGVKQEQKGFFCSELIAKVYKDLQILTRDDTSPNYIASNKIYPYHFSEKFNIKLQMGGLSRQYDIHFNQDVMKKQYGQNFFKKK